jgi:hypothetical protein
MEVPPPYMPPRKKSNTGLIVGLVIGGVFLCCIGPIALLVGGGFWVFGKTKGLIQCTYAFRDVRDGIRMYAADHNGKLPPADTWQDEVAPYYEKVLNQSTKKDQKVFGIMPAGGTWGCEDGSGGKTGMAYNDDVAAQDLTKLETSTQVVLFEVQQATRNSHEKYSDRPISSGPKIFGSPRGWFIVRMNSEPSLNVNGRETPVNTGPN